MAPLQVCCDGRQTLMLVASPQRHRQVPRTHHNTDVLKTKHQPLQFLRHSSQSQILGALIVLLAASALEELDHVHLSVSACRIGRNLPSIIFGKRVGTSIKQHLCSFLATIACKSRAPAVTTYVANLEHCLHQSKHDEPCIPLSKGTHVLSLAPHLSRFALCTRPAVVQDEACTFHTRKALASMLSLFIA